MPEANTTVGRSWARASHGHDGAAVRRPAGGEVAAKRDLVLKGQVMTPSEPAAYRQALGVVEIGPMDQGAASSSFFAEGRAGEADHLGMGAESSRTTAELIQPDAPVTKIFMMLLSGDYVRQGQTSLRPDVSNRQHQGCNAGGPMELTVEGGYRKQLDPVRRAGLIRPPPPRSLRGSADRAHVLRHFADKRSGFLGGAALLEARILAGAVGAASPTDGLLEAVSGSDAAAAMLGELDADLARQRQVDR